MLMVPIPALSPLVADLSFFLVMFPLSHTSLVKALFLSSSSFSYIFPNRSNAAPHFFLFFICKL